MDNKLTLAVKAFAYELGADLVGVANIERYANAPIRMSPQGILPTAKSVVVCAIHHPDAAIELDGEEHPQIMGPYRVQYTMNSKLDVLSFRIARMLDDLGYETVPIASSNIWRYRGYKDLTAVFAPDISHIYSAVCAGLGELGWNGLAMSPEYGARNRFISIITEAELTPTPLYSGEKLCDMCGECIRKCPTDAYRKEVSGVKNVVIDGKDHKFCDKNLWRCAWGEHFDVDLDLKIPDVVTEEVILQNVRDHGLRGGEFGVCLKVCLPKPLRYWDPSYNKVCARRKRHMAPTDLPVHRNVYDKVLKHANLWDLDSVHFLSRETLEKADIDIRATLPDGVSAILLTARFPFLPKDAPRSQEIEGEFASVAQLNLDFTELDACRELEALGYSALPKARIDHKPFRTLCGIYEDEKTHIRTEVILTSAPFADKSCTLLTEVEPKGDLRTLLERFARTRGADLFGVASADTIGKLADQLRDLRKDEELLLAVDKNTRFKPYDPEVAVQKRKIYDARDLLPGAKSVLVLGMHYPETATERVGQPPAEAVGPYVFTQYEVHRLIGHLGYALARTLNAMGYQAVFTHNLTGAGSYVGSPRGPFHDATCNALEAVAAGIGKMAYNGSVETEEYGIHQRFIALVTDAPLAADRPQSGEAEACAACGKCLEACPTCALCAKALMELELNGEKVHYLPVDANRCDWASKYALVCEEGNVYLGNLSDVPCPDEITPENLKAALRTQDSVFKYRPVTAERCIVVCPLNGRRDGKAEA